MMVQYVGYVNKKNGKEICFLYDVNERLGEGKKPILVKGKFGYTLPYVSNKTFNEKFANLKVGEFLEGEYTQYGSFLVN